MLQVHGVLLQIERTTPVQLRGPRRPAVHYLGGEHFCADKEGRSEDGQVEARTAKYETNQVKQTENQAVEGVAGETDE